MGRQLDFDELLQLIPLGSTVHYALPDKSICVIHDPEGNVLAILSNRSTSSAAHRARLIACMPLLLAACTGPAIELIQSRVSTEPESAEPKLGSYPHPEDYWRG